MRLFAALEVAPEVVAALDDVVTPLREAHPELGWTRPDGWHLTVAFLGEVADPAEAVATALAPAATGAPPQIALSLAGAGHFGRRALWVGVRDEPPGAMGALGADAQAALTGAGLPVDRKDVRPHLTLARTRRERRGGQGRRPAGGADAGATVARLALDLPPVEASWTVRDLVLFRSVRSGARQPNRYEAVARLPLGGTTGS